MTTEMIFVILGTGILTFCMRYAPLVIMHKKSMPWYVKRLLNYLPLSVIGALLGQAVFLENGQLQISPLNPYLLGAVACVILGLRTRNLSVLVLSGMAIVFMVTLFTELP